jgi:4-hydroxy-tetrahydrodipicolinate synthase
MKKFEGTGVALITPFTKNKEVDFKAFEKLLVYVTQKKGVDYLVLMGTTGESATLTKEEKKKLMDFAVKFNKGKKSLVLGLGGNNTEELIKMANETDFKGFDAILSVTPYYNKPSQRGIIEHYKALAAAFPLPIILYNVPGRTSVNMTAETTLALSKVKNIIGIKEASGNLEQCLKIAANKPKDFLLLSGEDLLTPSMIAFGAEGVISVLANLYPVEFSEMVRFGMKYDFVKAQKLLFDFDKINHLMYSEGNPVGVKAGLNIMGVCKPHVRLPLAEASAELTETLKKAMKGLFK